MSEFTSAGHDHFPNLYSDSQEIHEVAEWPRERLDYKTDEYGAFTQRSDLMPRAVTAAGKILDYLLFEMAYRDGVYGGKE